MTQMGKIMISWSSFAHSRISLHFSSSIFTNRVSYTFSCRILQTQVNWI